MAHSHLLDVEEEIEAVLTSSESNFVEDELLISESDGDFISTPIFS